MTKTTAEAAQGRWREILPALGIPAIFLNGKHQACPMCGGKDRARFHDRTGEGNYICGQCGAGSGFILLQKFHGWTFAQAARAVDEVLGNLPERKPFKPYTKMFMTDDQVISLWRDARPIQNDDPVANYLIGRAIDKLAHWPVALRFTERYWHSTAKRFLPCMLGLLQAPDGSIGTIHRTYLADVTPNKMFLPRRIPIGGAIRLFEPGTEMGIAEGIETALSASMLTGIPVWATTSARLLMQWQPPAGAKWITIFGDRDKSCTGQAAAYDLAHRLILRQGYMVRVCIPGNDHCWSSNEEGRDWNDCLKDGNPNDLSKLRSLDWRGGFAPKPVSDTRN